MDLTRRGFAAMPLLVLFPAAAQAASAESFLETSSHINRLSPTPKSFKLNLVNAWGQALNTPASVGAVFRSGRRSWPDHFRKISEEPIDINCRDASACSLTINADYFHPAKQQILISPDQPVHTVKLAIADTDKIIPVCPSYAKLPSVVAALFKQCGGERTYEDLAVMKKAGLLGIMAKAVDFKFPNGRPVANYIQDLHTPDGLSDIAMVYQDRFFASVSPDIISGLEQAVLAGSMERASNRGHQSPAGYEKMTAYKSIEKTKRGIFNVNLHGKIGGKEGEEIVGEFDLDESIGLAHNYTVARHKVVIAFQSMTGKRNEGTGRSDPRKLAEFLLEQGLYPGWVPANMLV